MCQSSHRTTAHLAFGTTHAGVAALYFTGVLLLAMFTVHPVYALLSLVGALAFSLCAIGARRTLGRLRWQLPLIALVTLANPLFSASGSTVLWRMGPLAVHLESLAYGACMGTTLVAVIHWFEGAAHVLTGERIMGLMGRCLPVVALMTSMTAQLAGQLVRRGGQARAAQRACTASRTGHETVLRRGAALSTTLMSWAMEDSLERSDAMRARAWRAAPHRTSYAPERLGDRDVLALLGILALLAPNALLAAVACAQWRFYPTMPALVAWWGYLPYAALVLLPTVLTVREGLRWRRLERTGMRAGTHASVGEACTAAWRAPTGPSDAEGGRHGHATT